MRQRGPLSLANVPRLREMAVTDDLGKGKGLEGRAGEVQTRSEDFSSQKSESGTRKRAAEEGGEASSGMAASSLLKQDRPDTRGLPVQKMEDLASPQGGRHEEGSCVR